MQSWLRITIVVVVVLAVLYGVYAAVVSPSSSNQNVSVNLGTYSDGSMYMKCNASESDPGVCDAANPSLIHLKKGAKEHWTAHNDDGGAHTHDFKLDGGWAYFLPPARVEMELQNSAQSTTVTMWHAGTYTLLCELKGHAAAGMKATVIIA